MKNKINLFDEMFLQRRNKALFDQARLFAMEYLEEIGNRAVFPTDETLKLLSAFDEPLPEKSCDPEEVLRLLHRNGSPATVAQTGGRYFGFVNGSSLPVSLSSAANADTMSIGSGTKWGLPCGLNGRLVRVIKSVHAGADEAISTVNATYRTVIPTNAPNADHNHAFYYIVAYDLFMG